MAILSITKAAERVGVSRSTMHLHLAKGRVSKSPDGGIDESELLRVYGNFKTPYATPIDNNQTSLHSVRQTPLDSNKTHVGSGKTHSDSREVELLMEMIEMLKNQLIDAKNQINDAKTEIERLQKKEDQWMAIFQNRLPAPMSEKLSDVKNKMKSFFE